MTCRYCRTALSCRCVEGERSKTIDWNRWCEAADHDDADSGDTGSDNVGMKQGGGLLVVQGGGSDEGKMAAVTEPTMS